MSRLTSLFKKFHKEPRYPAYWKDYAALFETAQPTTFDTARFVVFDTETTGFNYVKDKVLCIGALTLSGHEIKVNATKEIYIKQSYFNEKTVAIHGILKNESVALVEEETAVIDFLKYIENSILVAHHATFDVEMVNAMLKGLGLPRLKNKWIDTNTLYKATRIKSNLISPDKSYSLDEIAENYGLDVTDRHTALGDALITALIFLKASLFLRKKNKVKLQDLLNS